MARPEDAARYLALLSQVELETPFLLFESEECVRTVEQQARVFESLASSDSKCILVAEGADHELVGYVGATCGPSRKTRHRASLAIAVASESWGRGVGSGLLRALESWANEQGIVRLELSVRCDNRAAIELYKARGFSIDGTRPQALWVGGQLYDEYYMSKNCEDRSKSE